MWIANETLYPPKISAKCTIQPFFGSLSNRVGDPIIVKVRIKFGSLSNRVGDPIIVKVRIKFSLWLFLFV